MRISFKNMLIGIMLFVPAIADAEDAINDRYEIFTVQPLHTDEKHSMLLDKQTGKSWELRSFAMSGKVTSEDRYWLPINKFQSESEESVWLADKVRKVNKLSESLGQKE